MTFKTLVKDILITEVSQSKKIRKYVDFSVVLQWYKNNQSQIADILDAPIEELANVEDLISQSNELVTRVINPQSQGNSETNFRSGFYSFEKLEQKLIHDILHNLYDVSIKEFDKNINDYEFDESEIIEEIECLAIEESFMKYLNIPYLKSDFINQNINNLASYLMVSIMKEDPERFINIVSGKIEPYLEVYGKKYPTNGTPYEGLFSKLAKNIPVDPTYGYEGNYSDNDNKKVESERDIKDFLIELIRVGQIIGYFDSNVTGGDRAGYPTNDEKEWRGYKDKDHIQIQNEFYRKYLNHTMSYTGKEVFKDFTNIIYTKYFPEIKKNINDNNINIDDYDEVLTQVQDVFSNYEADNDLTYTNTEEVLESGDLTSDFIEYYKEDSYFTKDNIDSDYILNYFDEDEDENKYVLIFNSDNNEFVKTDNSYLEDDMNYVYDEIKYELEGADISDDDTGFNYNNYKDKTIDELFEELISIDDSRAIIRRYFRTNDILANNTDMGYSDDQRTFMDFSGKNTFPSISKNLLTDNSKKLYKVLNHLKGYLISNFDSIKDEYKEFYKFVKNNPEDYKTTKETIIKTVTVFKYSIDTWIIDLLKNYTNLNVYMSGHYKLTMDSYNVTSKLKSLDEHIKYFNDIHILINDPKKVEIITNKLNNFIYNNSMEHNNINDFDFSTVSALLKTKSFAKMINYYSNVLKMIKYEYSKGLKIYERINQQKNTHINKELKKIALLYKNDKIYTDKVRQYLSILIKRYYGNDFYILLANESKVSSYNLYPKSIANKLNKDKNFNIDPLLKNKIN